MGPNVQETTVGKRRLAELLGWSRTTLDRRLGGDPSFPVECRGGQGGGWAFDVAKVFSYLRPDDGPAQLPVRQRNQGVRVSHQGEETARHRLLSASAAIAENRLREQRAQLAELGSFANAAELAADLICRLLDEELPKAVRERLALGDRELALIQREIAPVTRAVRHDLSAAVAAQPGARPL